MISLRVRGFSASNSPESINKDKTLKNYIGINMKLSDSGICKCGGKLTASEWKTKTHRKGRTTCSACGRTELRTQKNHLFSSAPGQF